MRKNSPLVFGTILYIFKYMGCSLKKVKQFLKNPKVGFPKFIREN
ncbi:hypothetical protein LEP1GSC084_3128 [Leptospira interrogans serovar Medanensis str. L0448]|nr:hypothetical protein LEP1GSC099_0613 [Leptospira interrogans str. UI 08452]EMN37257.1 hypothetical protein LEP1GSC084_3128 [Leptospira interrogans serovar Medanensis str. L0448]EMN40803.1 hypothetical protein LEP1GSC085_1683 [Leptospira interrogans str. L0996]EMN93148.1 hypothetical protein LEP1GSC110_4584 [Leptospira interrogans serovar Medanensis str. UT053]